MSITVVPNPTKEIRVNYPIAKVQEAIKKLPEYAKTAKLVNQSDTSGYYRFEATGKGLFNLGMYLEITTQDVGGSQTIIQLEGRRRVGWIDNGAELTDTTEYLIGCITLLGKVLSGEK